jgi:serine/threonine-protein kinase RsbW
VNTTGTREHRYNIDAKLEAIHLVQEAIEHIVAPYFDKGRTFQLNMAVEELLTNVVRHSGTTEKIGVVVRDEPQAVSVELIDAGAPFDPFTQAAPPALDAGVMDRPIGGLGVHLVRTMLDQVQYQRADDRNHVLLTMFKGGSNG